MGGSIHLYAPPSLSFVIADNNDVLILDHTQPFTTVGAFRITPSHLRKIGGSPSAAQFPPEAGGGYLGFMEVLHQIHCVVSSSHPSFKLQLQALDLVLGLRALLAS